MLGSGLSRPINLKESGVNGFRIQLERLYSEMAAEEFKPTITDTHLEASRLIFFRLVWQLMIIFDS
jgi:hypothetical protein